MADDGGEKVGEGVFLRSPECRSLDLEYFPLKFRRALIALRIEDSLEP
jgi:hypothetical protein